MDNLSRQVEQLQSENEKLKFQIKKHVADKEKLVDTLKEHKQARDEMFKLKDAKIATLAQEII